MKRIMIDKVYLDASFLIASQIPQHLYYKASQKILKKLQKSELYLSLFAVDEFLYVMRKYGFEKETIAAFLIENVLGIKNLFIIGYPEKKESAQEYVSVWQKNGLRPADSLHLTLMRIAGLKYLATFDQDFIDRQKELGIKTL